MLQSSLSERLPSEMLTSAQSVWFLLHADGSLCVVYFAATAFCVKVTQQELARKELCNVHVGIGSILVLLMSLGKTQCVFFLKNAMDLKLILPEVIKVFGLICCFHLLTEKCSYTLFFWVTDIMWLALNNICLQESLIYKPETFEN